MRMKQKEFAATITQTVNTGNYNSFKIGFDLTIELEENDDLAEVKNKAMETLRGFVKEEIEKEKKAAKNV
jgi:predicted TIM-barrel fold metal-dependent hydrolase